jgi:hypothetical protein
VRSYEKNCLHIDATTTHLFVYFAAYDIMMLSCFIAGNNITILQLHEYWKVFESIKIGIGLLMSVIKY